MNEARARIINLAEHLGLETKGKSESTLCKEIRLARKESALGVAHCMLNHGVKSARAEARDYVASAKVAYDKAKATYEEALSAKRLAFDELQYVKAVRTAVNKAAPAYREKEKAEKAKAKAEKAKTKEEKEKAKQIAYIEKLKARLDKAKAIAEGKVA